MPQKTVKHQCHAIPKVQQILHISHGRFYILILHTEAEETVRNLRKRSEPLQLHKYKLFKTMVFATSRKLYHTWSVVKNYLFGRTLFFIFPHLFW